MSKNKKNGHQPKIAPRGTAAAVDGAGTPPVDEQAQAGAQSAPEQAGKGAAPDANLDTGGESQPSTDEDAAKAEAAAKAVTANMARSEMLAKLPGDALALINAKRKTWAEVVDGIHKNFGIPVPEIDAMLIAAGGVKPTQPEEPAKPPKAARKDPNQVAVVAENKIKSLDDVLPKPIVSPAQSIIDHMAKIGKSDELAVELVVCLSPRAFVLRLDGGLTFQMNKGVNKVERFLAEHSYSLANGVKIV